MIVKFHVMVLPIILHGPVLGQIIKGTDDPLGWLNSLALMTDLCQWFIKPFPCISHLIHTTGFFFFFGCFCNEELMNYYASHFTNEKTGPERLNDGSKVTQLGNCGIRVPFSTLPCYRRKRFVSLEGEPFIHNYHHGQEGNLHKPVFVLKCKQMPAEWTSRESPHAWCCDKEVKQ